MIATYTCNKIYFIKQTVLSDFFDMKCYPYETETSFKSTYIEDFENVRTQSIKRYNNEEEIGI